MPTEQQRHGDLHQRPVESHREAVGPALQEFDEQEHAGETEGTQRDEDDADRRVMGTHGRRQRPQQGRFGNDAIIRCAAAVVVVVVVAACRSG